MSKKFVTACFLGLAAAICCAQDVTVNAGKWQVSVDKSGVAEIEYDGTVLISKNEAQWWRATTP